MFTIITDAFGVLLWGLAVAVVVTAAVVRLCYILCRGLHWNVWGIAATVALFVLTLVQGTLWVGAMYASDYVEGIATVARAVTERSQAAAASVKGDDIKAIKEGVADEFPMLRAYIEDIDINPDNCQGADSIVTAIEDDVNTSITWYQARRLLWMLGFAVVATAVICSKGGRSRGLSGGSGAYSPGTSSGLKF